MSQLCKNETWDQGREGGRVVYMRPCRPKSILYAISDLGATCITRGTRCAVATQVQSRKGCPTDGQASFRGKQTHFIEHRSGHQS